YLGFLPGQLLFEDLICRSNKSLQHLFVPALDHQQLRRCGADLSSVSDAASCKPVDNLRIARTPFPLEVRDQLAEAAKVRRPIKLTNAFNGLELLEQMIVLNEFNKRSGLFELDAQVSLVRQQAKRIR